MSQGNGTLLVATDPNWLIGDRPDFSEPGITPWQGELPADMRYFQEQTRGKKVLFGRPTYLSIPERFRPLKDRDVAVLTGQDLELPGCKTVHSLNEGFEWANGEELIIAGGGQVYLEAIDHPNVKRILRTVVEHEFAGNVYFPPLFEPEWKLVNSEAYEADEKNKYPYRFETYDWNIRRMADISVTAYPFRIVDPRNARSRKYLRQLLLIQRSGLCPFCPGGETYIDEWEMFIAQNDNWLIKHSKVPYDNAQVHLVIIPKRHVTRESELTAAEMKSRASLIQQCLSDQGLPAKAGNLFAREGETEGTGATVCHLHFNYVIPQPGKVITVRFGGWAGEPEWLT